MIHKMTLLKHAAVNCMRFGELISIPTEIVG